MYTSENVECKKKKNLNYCNERETRMERISDKFRRRADEEKKPRTEYRLRITESSSKIVRRAELTS